MSKARWVQHARLQNGEDYVQWPDLFEFVISADGHQIAGRFFNKTSLEAFHTHLLGQVISYALLKQGIEPLHASVIVINGEAVALLGNSGHGKSSLVAAFLQDGATLLTDDLLVVRKHGGEWLAYPGPARIKLFPEVAQSYLGNQATGAPLSPFTNKMVIPLKPEQLTNDISTLKAVYLLPPPTTRSHSTKVTLRKRSARQACMDFIANTFNSVIKTPDRLKRQLDVATRLATDIPVKSISYKRELLRLPDVVRAIKSDLAK